MRRALALVVVLAVILAAIWWWRHAPREAPPPSAPAVARSPSPTRAPSPLRLSSGVASQAAAGESAESAELSGRVLSSVSGQGIAGAELTLSSAAAVSVTTDAHGEFRWVTDQPGVYQLTSLVARGFSPFAPGLGQSPVVFDARRGVRVRGVTLYLSPSARVAEAGPTDGGTDPDAVAERRIERGSGRIRGTVRDKEGHPVVAFSIVAEAHKGAVERGEAVTSSFFAADGSYELAVRPGRWAVIAVAQDRSPSAEQNVDVTEEARADFTLSRGATLRGRVIDAATRSGLAGARVSLENLYGADTSLPLPVIASTETDASGAFTLSGLQSGAVSLIVTADGHHNRVVPGVRPDSDGVVIDLTATLPGEKPSIESAGINAAVRANGDQLLIDRVSPGGGADAAGIKAGDIILRVAGTDVTSLGMQPAVEAMRGPPGTTVVLTLRRPPDAAPFDLTVERRRIINR